MEHDVVIKQESAREEGEASTTSMEYTTMWRRVCHNMLHA
jgi:hypothetical protein